MTPYERRLEAIREVLGPDGDTSEGPARKLGRPHDEVCLDMCGQGGLWFHWSDKLRRWFRSKADRAAAER